MKKKASSKKVAAKPSSKVRKDFTIVEETLPFKLTEKEINTYATEAAELDHQIKKEIDEMKAAAATARATIKEKMKRLDELMHKVRSKTEDRKVECQRVLNEKEKQTEFWYEGELIWHRPILESDRQTTLPLKKRAGEFPNLDTEEDLVGEKLTKKKKRDTKMAAANDDSFADEFAAL